MSKTEAEKQEILLKFRETLVEKGLLDETSTMGSDDGTLNRFLRARRYNLQDSTKMWADAYEWRKSCEGDGIDALYERLDPCDVSLCLEQLVVALSNSIVP